MERFGEGCYCSSCSSLFIAAFAGAPVGICRFNTRGG